MIRPGFDKNRITKGVVLVSSQQQTLRAVGGPDM